MSQGAVKGGAKPEAAVPGHVIISLVVIALAIIIMGALLRVLFGLAGKPRSMPRTTGGTRREQRSAPTSLAVLLAEPKPLEPEMLAAAVERAWGTRPANEETQPVAFVGHPTPEVATLTCRGTVLTVLSIAEPYPHGRDWYVRDETPGELLSAWQRHRAWLSIDLVEAAPGASTADVYKLIGKLLAELAGTQALAAFRPATRQAVAYDPETAALLRHVDPLTVVTGPPHALVLLRQELRTLEAGDLARIFPRAWGVQLAADPTGGLGGASDFFVVPKPTYAFIRYEGLHLRILAQEGAYPAEVEQSVPPHAAWMMVDMLEAPVGVSREHVYRLLARLAAEFVDAQTLALLAPALRRAVDATDHLADELRSEDPFRVFSHSAA